MIYMQTELNLEPPLKRAIMRYEQIRSDIRQHKDISQVDRVFKALYESYLEGKPLSLVALLSMYISAWRGRISDLRSEGWTIDCRSWTADNGDKHSEYRLVL